MIGVGGLEPGTLVDGWQVIRALRAGGFGAVHQAEQNGKAFALKVAHHREESGDTGRTHARALREVLVLLMMDHPNIIKPRGYGYLPDGRVYCVLEYVDGWTLGDWLERTHPTFREIARVFAQIAGAVAYMHARGVLHRDLKLSNVMIRKSDGEPIIIDLGCATYENAEELTTTPLPPGTERYRAPEAQEFFYKQGRMRGARYPFKVTDELFAVGVMLYELLTDPLPTKDNPRPHFAAPVASLVSPRELNPHVPDAFSALVEDLLARNPAQRPESFEALRRRLEELADHLGPEYATQAHPPSTQRQPAPVEGGQAAGLAVSGKQGGRKPLPLAGLVAAVVLAAGAAAWLAHRDRPAPGLPPAPREAAVLAAPGAGPAIPPVSSSPVSAPAPAPAQDSAPAAPATAPKEGSTVKPQPHDALKSPRTAGAPKAAPVPAKPGTPAWCKAVSLFVALAHPGCASVPLKAERFECPPGAVEAMEKLDWRVNSIGRNTIWLLIDERGPSHGNYGFTVGAPVTGVVPDDVSPERQSYAPPGTLFYGRIYVTEKTAEDPLGLLIAIYDHVEIPGKGKFPVCLVSNGNPIVELRDGIATARNNLTANPVLSWDPRRD